MGSSVSFVWPWTSSVASLSLSCLLCKMAVTTLTPDRVGWGLKAAREQAVHSVPAVWGLLLLFHALLMAKVERMRLTTQGTGLAPMATALCGHPTESALGGKPDSDQFSGHASHGTVTWAPESRELGKSCPLKHSSFCWGPSVYRCTARS